MFALRCYDYFRRHRRSGLCLLSAATLLLLAALLRLRCQEDIAAFLPLDDDSRRGLAIYQATAGAGNVIIVFQGAEPDELADAVDDFTHTLSEADSTHLAGTVTAQADMELVESLLDFVYAHAPYFLTPADYARMDSLLAEPEYVARRLSENKRLLLLPTGGLLTANLAGDPIGLFAPLAEGLQSQAGDLSYETYDGYLFSPDLTRAFVIVGSPYGGSETNMNARLIGLLERCIDGVATRQPDVSVHLTGGPAIAVGNARQIKRDSLAAVSVAVVLILALLLFTLHRVRNLLLIALSVGWGYLFAMGGLALLHNHVSVIVIGISSVILGIAVNYPLHFIAHLRHTADPRTALREIIAPLVVGNITTVGAFLTLTPLQSVALRDLGLFASLLLVGTIVFTVLCLPHLTKGGASGAKDGTSSAKDGTRRIDIVDRLCHVSVESKPWLVWTVAGLTVVLGYFSFQTGFDTDLSHINYMTAQQQDDMDYWSREMLRLPEGLTVCAVSSGATADEALQLAHRLQPTIDSLCRRPDVEPGASCLRYLSTGIEQERRLERWHDFVGRHADLPELLRSEAKRAGYADGAFDGFLRLFIADLQPLTAEAFEPLTQTVFAGSLCHDPATGQCHVVSRLQVPDRATADAVEQELKSHGAYAFDIAALNSRLTRHLSDNFNYIGWACGCIVFLFLWLALGSVELAALSFVPMAVSWLWILGIMALAGIQFNIVNVILATFIFGQGDDYTLFMTEGASYEYAYRRRMLPAYKRSIIISALTMFVGIGTLIAARHPALRSLAQVAMAGMFSVVLMAWLFPPLIFNFLVKRDGAYRRRPVRLGPWMAWAAWRRLRPALQIAIYSPCIGHRRFVQRLCRLALRLTPGVSYAVYDDETAARGAGTGKPASEPALWISTPAHPLAVVAVRASRPRLMVLKPGRLPDPAVLLRCRAMGCSLVLFGDPADKAWLTAAEELSLSQRMPLLTACVHGTEWVSPADSPGLYAGCLAVDLSPMPACKATHIAPSGSDLLQLLAERQAALAQRQRKAAHLAGLVLDRFRYKGADITSAVARSLRQRSAYEAWVDAAPAPPVVIVDGGACGELALLYALVHPASTVWAMADDDEQAALIAHSAEGIAPNLRVLLRGEGQIAAGLNPPTEPTNRPAIRLFRQTDDGHWITQNLQTDDEP